MERPTIVLHVVAAEAVLVPPVVHRLDVAGKLDVAIDSPKIAETLTLAPNLSRQIRTLSRSTFRCLFAPPLPKPFPLLPFSERKIKRLLQFLEREIC